MKLLLTSTGFPNKTIKENFWNLVGKKSEETTLVFIPTAANVVSGDKDWLIKDLRILTEMSFKSIDIVDISAVSKDVWLPRIESADVIFVEGGDTYHLMEWVNKSGLAELLPEMLKTKVYIGASAGSMIFGKNLGLELTQKIYEENLDRTKDLKGLNLIKFFVLPHLNSAYFLKVNDELIKTVTKSYKEKIYAIDDNSAVIVDDGNVEMIGDGESFEIN